MIEDRGLESLWFAEHSHLPSDVQWEGREPGDRYAKTFDPFVAMTAAAAATRTLKVATGVCLVPQRDQIHTAKQVASVDVLSDGRLIFGVGAGWNRQEMRNHGTDPKTRMRLLTERVQAMIEIWTNDDAEYTASGAAPDRETLTRLRDRGAHRALVWLPQDAAGVIADSDTERFLDDLATSASEI